MAKYIIDKRMRFPPGIQKKIIYDIKKKFNLRWKDMAEALHISEYTIRIDWGCERTTIPYSYMKSLIGKYPIYSWGYIKSELIYEILPPKWGQIKGGNASVKSRYGGKCLSIRFPAVDSPNFAEFVGIMLGDGHVSVHGIEISLEYPYEKEYMNYVRNLVLELFAKEPTIRMKGSKKTCIYLILNSKKLVLFLDGIGLKRGNKVKNGAEIPEYIFNDEALLRRCIRGLVDTDGGIFGKQRGYKRALIEFKNFSTPLLGSFERGVVQLGFHISRSNRNTVRIQNQNEIDKYFEEIGSSNKKNIIRYRYLKEFGYVPKREELNKIL